MASAATDGPQEADISQASSTLDTDELAAFRAQWQREIHTEPGESAETASSEDPEQQTDIAEEALRLHLLGEECEEQGNLQQATAFYRLAAKMVPDIEFKAFEVNKQASISRELEEAEDGTALEAECVVFEEEEDVLAILPEKSPKGTHIGQLPPELLCRVLQSVVDRDLDLRALETCSLVCRYLYTCARSTQVWHYAADRIYCPLSGLVNCQTLGSCEPFTSWRNLCLKRPRILFHGVYISKITYVRVGEQGLDQFYKPLHVIDYYRYLVFFENGDVCTMTTPETPDQIVPQLRHIEECRLPLMWGTFSVVQDKVDVTVHRMKMIPPKGARRGTERTELTGFNFQFQIKNRRRRAHASLHWVSHGCVIKRQIQGVQQEPIVTDYSLDGGHHKPFVFARVNTFSQRHEASLLTE